MKKRIISLITVLALLLGSVCVCASADKGQETRLRYNDDGKFTIMQISDLQDFLVMRPATKILLMEAVKRCPCDLIVLTGDNISSSSYTIGSAWLAIWQVMSVLEKNGTPVAITFGNHDDENTLATKKLQLRMYEQYDCFIGRAGEDLGSTNLCTYELPIYGSGDSNEIKNLVWMVDSGTYNTENDLGGYAATTKAQVDWYVRTSEKYESDCGGKVPGLMFQHIVVPEIWDALVPGSPSDGGGVWHNGSYLVLPEGAKGVLGEGPCPPNYTNGQFDAVAERGDVVAMFFGHDHTNTFEIPGYRGVDLVNTPGAGFRSYNSIDVGVRMIYLDESDPWSYETEVVSYFDLFDRNDPVARYLYEFDSSTTDESEHDAVLAKLVVATVEKLLVRHVMSVISKPC